MIKKDIIVAGNNDLAFNIVELLSHQHFVTLLGPSIVEKNRFTHQDNIEIICGEVTDAILLSQTPLTSGGVFIAATESDEMNLLSCMTVVALIRMAINDESIEISQTLAGQYQSKDLNVICILNHSGYGTLKNFDENFARELHIHRIIRPAQELATEIIKIAEIPGAQDVKMVAEDIMLLRIEVDDNAQILGKELKGAQLPKDVLIVVVSREGVIFLPDGSTVIEAGDRVTVIGRRRHLHLFMRNYLQDPHRSRLDMRASIVGGGEVGRLVALGLHERGWVVDILERSQEVIASLGALPEGIIVRQADGTEIQDLEANDLSSSSLLVSVTSSDEKNLLVSLLAQYIGVDRIITRADRLSNELMFERLGVDVVRSARGAAIRRVVREIVGNTEVKAELEHGVLQMVEVKVNPSFSECFIYSLQAAIQLKVIVAVISRKNPTTRVNEWTIPTGKTKIFPDDVLYLIVEEESSSQVFEYFKNGSKA